MQNIKINFNLFIEGNCCFASVYLIQFSEGKIFYSKGHIYSKLYFFKLVSILCWAARIEYERSCHFLRLDNIM